MSLSRYTSLDGVADTHPNPALLMKAGGRDYLPACMLSDEALERAGRTCKPDTPCAYSWYHYVFPIRTLRLSIIYMLLIIVFSFFMGWIIILFDKVRCTYLWVNIFEVRSTSWIHKANAYTNKTPTTASRCD